MLKLADEDYSIDAERVEDVEGPLGERTATMLDVAVRGVGNMWNDVVIPGLDFVLVEKTLGKYGPRVDVLTKLPINVQHLVGQG